MEAVQLGDGAGEGLLPELGPVEGLVKEQELVPLSWGVL